MTDVPDELFDEHGLPTGDLGRRIWTDACERLEQEINAGGWDAPAQLFALANPLTTEAGLGSDVVASLRRQVADPGAGEDSRHMSAAYAITKLANLEGYPLDAMWGITAPDWAAAVLLSFESWVKPPLLNADGEPMPDPFADMRPSQHPRRVEVRHVIMLTRSGHLYSTERRRDTGEVNWIGQQPGGGFIIEALHRVLGMPTDPPPTTVADLLGRIALRVSVSTVLGMAGQLPEADTRPVPAMLAKLDQARAGLDSLEPGERVEMLRHLTATTLMTSITGLAWDATNYGEYGVPQPLRRFVGKAARSASPIRPDDETLEAIRAATHAAAALTFTELVTGKRARKFLGTGFPQPAEWADEGLLCRWLCWRAIPSQPDMLEELTEHAGWPAADTARIVLTELGWFSDAGSGPDDDEAAQAGKEHSDAPSSAEQ